MRSARRRSKTRINTTTPTITATVRTIPNPLIGSPFRRPVPGPHTGSPVDPRHAPGVPNLVKGTDRSGPEASSAAWVHELRSPGY